MTESYTKATKIIRRFLELNEVEQGRGDIYSGTLSEYYNFGNNLVAVLESVIEETEAEQEYLELTDRPGQATDEELIESYAHYTNARDYRRTTVKELLERVEY